MAQVRQIVQFGDIQRRVKALDDLPRRGLERLATLRELSQVALQACLFPLVRFPGQFV
jgi:hypothetical protein